MKNQIASNELDPVIIPLLPSQRERKRTWKWKD